MLKKVKDYIKDEEFRLTLFSDRVHIINYKEILSLEDSRMSFTYDKKRVVMKGKGLFLHKLLEQEVLVDGKVTSIEVDHDEK